MKKNHMFLIQKIMEEGFGKARLEVIDECVSETFTEHQFGGGPGREGLKKIILSLNSGLSDLQYELQNHVETGDTVWTHFKATGFQTGPFMNLPPSGKKIEIDVIDIFRFENDLLVEHWGIPDRFAAMVQLGAFHKKEKTT